MLNGLFYCLLVSHGSRTRGLARYRRPPLPRRTSPPLPPAITHRLPTRGQHRPARSPPLALSGRAKPAAPLGPRSLIPPGIPSGDNQSLDGEDQTGMMRDKRRAMLLVSLSVTGSSDDHGGKPLKPVPCPWWKTCSSPGSNGQWISGKGPGHPSVAPECGAGPPASERNDPLLEYYSSGTLQLGKCDLL
jgi:hypothetical protein